MKRKMAKSFIIVFLTMFVSGCSTKLIYNYADWLIFWKVSDYVELNTEQKQNLEIKVETLLKWHRTEELPIYSALLKQLKTTVINKDIKAIDKFFMQGRDIWQRSVNKVTPEIINFLTLLSKNQKLELVKNIESVQLEKNEQWQEEFKQGENKKIEKTVERIEEYIGALTEEQKNKLMALDLQKPNILSMRIEGRKHWLELFSKAILLEPEMNKTQVKRLFTDLSLHRSEKQQELTEQITQLNLSKFRYLLKSMTDKQQTKLLIKIDEITTSLDELIIQS